MLFRLIASPERECVIWKKERRSEGEGGEDGWGQKYGKPNYW
jgi:hypothetical protein